MKHNFYACQVLAALLLILLLGSCKHQDDEVIAPIDQAGGVPLKSTACGSYRTFTQAAWGQAAADFSSPGAYRDRFFQQVFLNGAVNGLVIGIVQDSSHYYMRFTKVAAIQGFLPQTAPPTPLKLSVEDPSPGMQCSAFAGEVIALKLNLYYDDFEHRRSTLRTGTALRDLVITKGVFEGLDTWRLKDTAERALGGAPVAAVTYDLLSGKSRTYQFTLAQLHEAVQQVNQNFAGGVVDQGFLNCQ